MAHTPTWGWVQDNLWEAFIESDLSLLFFSKPALIILLLTLKCGSWRFFLASK